MVEISLQEMHQDQADRLGSSLRLRLFHVLRKIGALLLSGGLKLRDWYCRINPQDTYPGIHL